MFCCCVIVINPNIPSRLIFCEPAQLSRSVYCSLSIERARAHSLPRERERVSATPRSSVPFSCLCVFGLFFLPLAATLSFTCSLTRSRSLSRTHLSQYHLFSKFITFSFRFFLYYYLLFCFFFCQFEKC